MISEWTCTILDASSTQCAVTATSTDPSTLALHGELGTLIFGQAILILFATFIASGLLYNAIVKTK